MTGVLTTTYFVGSPNQATVTIVDSALPDDPISVATINHPGGIGYNPVNNSLIISRGDTTGGDKNFKRLNTNGVLSDWTTLTRLGYLDPENDNKEGEIKLGIVPVSANGWTQGDQYFGTGTPGKIGKISADGSTVVSTNWATLTNATQAVGETALLLGGLHIDQTGLFNGDMIVVSSSGAVWRVTASTNATKFAQINNEGTGIALEGVVTVPNDVAKYGPWAGKILTCAESLGLVLAIDTNGVVMPYNLGLSGPEDVRLISSGQNLYQADASGDRVLRYTADRFASFAGDILLVDELAGQCSKQGLYIVHWDGGRFVVRRLAFSAELEQATFAPIGL